MKSMLAKLLLLPLLLVSFSLSSVDAATLSAHSKKSPQAKIAKKSKSARSIQSAKKVKLSVGAKIAGKNKQKKGTVASIAKKSGSSGKKLAAAKAKKTRQLHARQKASGLKTAKAYRNKQEAELAALIASLEAQHKSGIDQGSSVSGSERKRFEIVNLAASSNFKAKESEVRTLASERDLDLPGKLSCRSAYIMDAKTGRPLYAKRPDQTGQPASTIKILTGLIAIENLSGQELVHTSSYAAGMPRSKIYLKQGASYLVDDLINAVLLSSANDASVALAEKIAGTEEAFTRMMTRKAQSLGAQQTICKSANGLTRPGQQTTARDLAVVFSRAMENREFAERMATTKVRTSDGRELRTHNKALWTVEGAVGGKTGYTDAARKTYVGKFQRGQQAIIVSLLGSEAMWTDVATLVDHGFALQQRSASLRDEENVGAVRVPIASQVKIDEVRLVEYPVLLGQKKKTRM